MSIAKLTELLTQRLRSDQFSFAEGTLNEYAKDETGKRVEIFFDPASFEAVGSDD